MKIRYLSVLAACALLFSGCESLDYLPGDQMSGQTFGKPKTMRDRLPWACMPR